MGKGPLVRAAVKELMQQPVPAQQADVATSAPNLQQTAERRLGSQSDILAPGRGGKARKRDTPSNAASDRCAKHELLHLPRADMTVCVRCDWCCMGTAGQKRQCV